VLKDTLPTALSKHLWFSQSLLRFHKSGKPCSFALKSRIPFIIYQHRMPFGGGYFSIGTYTNRQDISHQLIVGSQWTGIQILIAVPAE